MGLRTVLDHLVFIAPTRDAGADWMSRLLGVPMETGGEHPSMGTHNALLRLGADRYLEVLAPNSDAPAPARPRWFGLDHLSSADSPHLAAWVARTNDIEAAASRSRVPMGPIERASRGDLRWRITIPDDGSIPEHGVTPILIQWETEAHPAAALPDRGCSLVRLELYHPQPKRIRELLSRLGLGEEFTVSERPYPGLACHIQMPAGVRCFESFSLSP